MVEATLAANALFAVATGTVFVFVGRRVSRRRLEGPERVAMALFAVWWYVLGAITAASPVVSLWAAVRPTSVAFHATFLLVALLALCVALWALGYYLLFLYTGRTAFMVPLALFYGAFFIWIVYLIFQANPVGVEVNRWGAEIQYEHALLGGDLSSWLLLLLLAPQVVGALGYGSLYFKALDPEVRYRIALVSLSMLGWFGTSILASLLGWNDLEGWPLVSRPISLVAALFILMAYVPPGWVRRRIHGRPPLRPDAFGPVG